MIIDMRNHIEEKEIFKALPTGDYQASVVDTRLSMDNRPTLIVEFQLIGEPSKDGAMLNNRREKYRITLDTEYTTKILGQLLDNLDFKYDDKLDVEFMVKCQLLVGKMCKIHLEETEYLNKDGELRPCNRVKYTKKLDI